MQRLTRMDGLRGALAVYVMLGHALPFSNAPGWAQAIFRHGEAAVDLFFALSGLVIVHSLERLGGSFWPFMAARARRLLPVYFIVLAFSIILLSLGNPLPAMPWVGAGAKDIMEAALPAHLPAHLAAHVLLIQGIIPQAALPYSYVTLLGSAWSFSTEWQFYLLAGALAPKRLGGFALAMLAAGVGYHLLWPSAWAMSRAFLPDAAPFFALGLASAMWLRQNDAKLFVFCLLGACALGTSGGSGKLLVPLAWGVAMLAQRARWGAVLEGRVLQYLGAISYPLYLVNEPMLRALAMLLAPWAHGGAGRFTAIWLPLVLLCSLAAAMALHHAVELPFMRRAKRCQRLAVPLAAGT